MATMLQMQSNSMCGLKSEFAGDALQLSKQGSQQPQTNQVPLCDQQKCRQRAHLNHENSSWEFTRVQPNEPQLPCAGRLCVLVKPKTEMYATCKSKTLGNMDLSTASKGQSEKSIMSPMVLKPRSGMCLFLTPHVCPSTVHTNLSRRMK